MGPAEALRATARYLKDNASPRAMVKVARDATRLRFGIPLPALRWAATAGRPANGATGRAQAASTAPTDIELDAVPPALRLSASVNAMGTPLRVSAAIRIDEVFIASDTVRVAIRLNEVTLALLADSDSPVAMLIKSGVLDLSKPGNVVKVLPKRPAAIVDASADRIVLDLLKVPALAKNLRFRRALAVISPVLGVRAIETDGEHLYVVLRATPRGLREAVSAALAR